VLIVFLAAGIAESADAVAVLLVVSVVVTVRIAAVTTMTVTLLTTVTGAVTVTDDHVVTALVLLTVTLSPTVNGVNGSVVVIVITTTSVAVIVCNGKQLLFLYYIYSRGKIQVSHTGRNSNEEDGKKSGENEFLKKVRKI